MNRDVLAEALRQLRRRELSTTELRRKLLSRAFDHNSVEEVITYLSEQRLLDDALVGEHRVELLRKEGRAISRDALAQRLEDAGLSSRSVSIDDESELSAMAALLTKKYPNGAVRGRAGRFLVGRGFDEGLVHTALDRWNEGVS